MHQLYMFKFRRFDLLPYPCYFARYAVVHVIGEVAGALGFASSRLYAHYKMVFNTEHWHVMQGVEEGYTQVDETSVS